MPLGIALLLIWLVLLVRFPRIMLPASGIIVALTLVLAAGVGIWQWQDGKDVERLDISIRHMPEACDFGKPLQVRIHNHADRTASHISWRLLARQPGYNTNLLDTGVTESIYQTSQPLAAGEQWQQCYSVPRLRSGYRPADLEYQADKVRADFTKTE
ncbi:hypothetical protein ACBQ16_02675 [Halopseudomonas bauzanensis]|uniref:hypothetical protein n=1 Tax=Halopseudomonas bauzanensis TaxID=653930 RepID=UPI0035249957